MKLIAKGISKSFLRGSGSSNILTVVEPTDVTIEESQMIVLTGRSGGGKTTLLNMLSGLLQPTEGTIYADEINIYVSDDEESSSFRAEHFGLIPQGLSAIYSMNVLENILLPYTLYEDREDHTEYALELMDEFGIADLKDARPKELSGGELRRMSIARALIRKPDIIFADEPTGDLDDENTKIVLDKLKLLTKENTSVFLVTHEEAAIDYADRILRMDGGIVKG